MICSGSSPSHVTIKGNGFLIVDGINSTIQLDNQTLSIVNFSSCTSLPIKKHSIFTCNEVTVVIPTLTINQLTYQPNISIIPPFLSDCLRSTSTGLIIVQPPILTTSNPPIACVNEQEKNITLIGDNFFLLDNNFPIVTITTTTTTKVPVLNMTNCTSISLLSHTLYNCKAIIITIPQSNYSQITIPIIEIITPPLTCINNNTNAIILIPPPFLSSVSYPAVCNTSELQSLTFYGNFFVIYNETYPTLTVDSSPIQPILSNCKNLSLINNNNSIVSVCKDIEISINSSIISNNGSKINVTNPFPLSCWSQFSQPILKILPPNIISVSPQEICHNKDYYINVEGNFTQIGNYVPYVYVNNSLSSNVSLSSCSNM